jgi:Domain of unknown function (DUF1844)
VFFIVALQLVTDGWKRVKKKKRWASPAGSRRWDAACSRMEADVKLVCNFQEHLLRIPAVADAKNEETFKVVDRRLFGEDGELRQDVVEQERRNEEAAEKKAAAQAEAKAKAAAAAATTAKSAPGQTPSPLAANTDPQGAAGNGSGLAPVMPEDAAAEAQDSGDINPTSRSFQMLIDFLTRNAAAMLGGMADPRTGQAFVDLEGAREVIDMLDALREKTRGNLSKDDDNLLIEVIGSLKLTFMEISKVAAEQMAKKAKAK